MAARQPGVIASSFEEALRLADGAMARGPRPFLTVATGSLILVGHVRSLLLGLPRDPPVAL
jgi:hypothetical protein